VKGEGETLILLCWHGKHTRTRTLWLLTDPGFVADCRSLTADSFPYRWAMVYRRRKRAAKR
jgi:hypothetical protein